MLLHLLLKLVLNEGDLVVLLLVLLLQDRYALRLRVGQGQYLGDRRQSLSKLLLRRANQLQLLQVVQLQLQLARRHLQHNLLGDRVQLRLVLLVLLLQMSESNPIRSIHL